MKKVLLQYYQEIRDKHSLASLYHFVDENKDTLVQGLGIREAHFSTYDFLHILSEYVEGGLYSFLFNVGADQTYKCKKRS